MSFVIFEGEGTYTIDGVTFRAGATRCSDPAIIEEIRSLGLAHMWVQDDRSPLPVPESDPPPPPREPFEKWKGRDDKWYFVPVQGDGVSVEQSPPFDEEEDVDVAIAAAKKAASLIPLAGTVEQGGLSGTIEPEDLESDFPCRGEGCERIFQNTGARVNHERIMHRAELFDAKT